MLHNHETIKTVFAIIGMLYCVSIIALWLIALAMSIRIDKEPSYEQEEE